MSGCDFNLCYSISELKFNETGINFFVPNLKLNYRTITLAWQNCVLFHIGYRIHCPLILDILSLIIHTEMKSPALTKSSTRFLHINDHFYMRWWALISQLLCIAVNLGGGWINGCAQVSQQPQEQQLNIWAINLVICLSLHELMDSIMKVCIWIYCNLLKCCLMEGT